MYTITEKPTEDSKMIREQVFVLEQHFVEEFDAFDDNCRHVVLYINNQPAATCRYYETAKQGVYTIGRVAVLPAYRGQQKGKAIMDIAEKAIAEQGGTRVTLASQVQAQGFYEKCGYTPVSEIFLEENCPHIQMEKPLCLAVPLA